MPAKPVQQAARSAGSRTRGRGTKIGMSLRDYLWRRLPEFAVFHDGAHFFTLLQQCHVRERIAIEKYQVGQVTGSYLADTISHTHDFPTQARGGKDRIHRRKSQ